MKDIKNYLYENLEEQEDIKSIDNSEDINEDETITDEDSFREWAHAKFEEVFGDDLDKDQMEETIDGFLEDHKSLVEQNLWGELVGMMNQSFAQ